MEREALTLDNLAIATAARNCGGIVIAQVERLADVETLSPRQPEPMHLARQLGVEARSGEGAVVQFQAHAKRRAKRRTSEPTRRESNAVANGWGARNGWHKPRAGSADRLHRRSADPAPWNTAFKGAELVQLVDGSPYLLLASQSRAQLLRQLHVQLALFNDDPVERFGIFNRDNIVEDIFVNQDGGAIEGIAVAAG